MKPIIHVVMLCFLCCATVCGKIKNGYESRFEENSILLKNLQSLLEDNLLSPGKRRATRMEIRSLEDFFVYYELTDKILEQLRTISPSIDQEVAYLPDKKGRETDIYVRLVPRERANTQLSGASFFNGSPSDPDASFSIYGKYSVSVDIWIGDNALLLLCHELGHIKYIVPNFASYVAFYKKRYSTQMLGTFELGHRPDDQSGKFSEQFVRRYVIDRRNYVSMMNRKPERVMALMARIKEHVGRAIDLNTSVASSGQY